MLDRRTLLLAGAGLGFLSIGRARATGSRGAVLVVNSAEASLSVVDVATRREVRRFPVLREPHHVMLSPDKADLLVGDTVGNELLFLDPDTFAIRRRMVCADPYQIGFSPDGRHFVVNGLARAQVDVYDASGYKLIKRFPAKSMPSHMAFAPDASRVFVSLQGSNKLMAIDLNRLEELWAEPIGATPAGTLWWPGSGAEPAAVLVADMGQDGVAVADPATGRVRRWVKTGKGAHQIFWNPDRKLLWVNNRVEGSTTTLDAATLAPVRTYKLPGGPDDIDFAPDGTAWFTLRFAHKVAVLDPRTGDYQTIEVGRSPHGIFLNPNAHLDATA
jgi:DNA-binding beta-propeller fold protein YncE